MTMTLSTYSRPRALIGGVCCVVALIALAIFSRSAQADKPASPAAPAVLVSTARVQSQTVPNYLSGVGSVTAAQTVTVKARIDGQLDKIGFTEGQDVKVGQLLAQLDARALQAQLAQAQAQKARDAALLGNARTDLQRYTTLVAQDAATTQQLETQRALVAQLEAAQLTDDAQINYAQVQLSFTKITAPISGRVGARLIDVGNIVHAADALGLVVINQIDPITVVFTLPEESVPAINQAVRSTPMPLVVQAFARDGKQPLATGQLVLLNNQIDPATGMVQLKAKFANATHALWPGQFVNVRLVLGQRSQALTVPSAAVQRSQDGTYVYVVKDDNTVHSQPIKLVRQQDGIAIVDSGLKAADRVVVDGQYKLKQGSSITESQAGKPVVAASAPAAGAAK
jgi:multidrug efflux system membrane fusion protein